MKMGTRRIKPETGLKKNGIGLMKVETRKANSNQLEAKVDITTTTSISTDTTNRQPISHSQFI